MITYPYKVVLSKNKKAFIVDDQGIEYFEFKPHPDGDPWMDKQGVEITLDKLKIPRVKEWQDCPVIEDYPTGWIELQLNIEEEI